VDEKPRNRILAGPGLHARTSTAFVRYNSLVLPRNLRPMRLSRRSEPFDSDLFIYELKIDGFRALAHIHGGQGELISRNGNTFHGFADLAAWIAEHLRVESAVLDGEIACLDESGRPAFRDLRSANQPPLSCCDPTTFCLLRDGPIPQPVSPDTAKQ
jgi:ATP-dependent DNA ligase